MARQAKASSELQKKMADLRRRVGSMQAAQRARREAPKVEVGEDGSESEKMSRQHVQTIVEEIHRSVRSIIKFI